METTFLLFRRIFSFSSLTLVVRLVLFLSLFCHNTNNFVNGATQPTVVAFGIKPPQPAGLSPEFIADLARKRYCDPNDKVTGQDDAPLTGRVAVITGAAGGIGRALAGVVHSLGGTVVALDRDVTGLTMLEETLGKTTDSKDTKRVVILPTQHEDLASVAKSADQILSKFDRVDLLINNAGVAYSPDKTKVAPLSKHGNDLAFTVNYLSHFLLVEKLLPTLSKSDGRIVHLTSTFHWKVDGSELIPGGDDKCPMAYQGDPAKQSPKHVIRSYGNTKLAQLWHSRRIQGCDSVCACPTWVGTGIAGEESREFLEQWAFPVGGAGISSALNAMFRRPEELGDALNNGKSFVANSRMLEYLPGTDLWLTSDLVTNILGWRDQLADLCGLTLLLGQRFTFEDFIVQRTSPESYGKQEGMDAFYVWSREEVQPWL